MSKMKGLGFFLMSGDMYETPADVVEKLQLAKARWAALWINSPDGRVVRTSKLLEMSAAIRAAGLDVWVWTFPNADSPVTDAELVIKKAEEASAVGIILDIELPFKGKKVAAKKYVAALKENLATHDLEVAFTSYPSGHGTLPWSTFAEVATVGMPQLYTSAASNNAIRKSFDYYGSLFKSTVPVLATYIEHTARLEQDLHAVCLKDGVLRVDGVALWVLKTTDKAECAVLSKFVTEYMRGC